jgi:hypothetical protein
VAETSTAIPEQISDVVDSDLHREIWQRIAGRLQRGDTLITTEDFLTVLEIEYKTVTGNLVNDTLREIFGRTISSFN